MIDLSGLGRAEAEVVVLMGTGAVAGAWNPVLDALGERIPTRSPHAANVYFATLVHRLRWLKAMTVKPGIAEAHRRTYVHALEEALTELREVTTGIAASLRAWDGNKLRPEARIIRERLLYREHRFAVVSTNWDFSADEFLEGEWHDRCCGIHYLHGTYSVGLYLPGEVIDEPYRGLDNRSEFFMSALGTVHKLRDASRLVVYGLSISPLDAELGFLLQAAARQRKQQFAEVFVVDPNHKEVIQTLRVHLGNQNYLGVDPGQLQGLELPDY
jgi:hypothetical protein